MAYFVAHNFSSCEHQRSNQCKIIPRRIGLMTCGINAIFTLKTQLHSYLTRVNKYKSPANCRILHRSYAAKMNNDINRDIFFHSMLIIVQTYLFAVNWLSKTIDFTTRHDTRHDAVSFRFVAFLTLVVHANNYAFVFKWSAIVRAQRCSALFPVC